MDLKTKADVVDLAVSEAKQWFGVQLEAEVPELEPVEAWVRLNTRYPDNAKASEVSPTDMDRLFRTVYMATTARLWADESEKRVRALILEVGQ